jgi:hypothetical protein
MVNPAVHQASPAGVPPAVPDERPSQNSHYSQNSFLQGTEPSGAASQNSPEISQNSPPARSGASFPPEAATGNGHARAVSAEDPGDVTVALAEPAARAVAVAAPVAAPPVAVDDNWELF